MPEIGLGIGKAQGTYRGWSREWLYWYDSDGNRLLSPDERAEQAQQQLEQERRKTEELLARLRERGIDPDKL